MAEKMSRRPPIAIILAVFLACVSVLLSVSFVMHPGSLSRFRRKNTAQGWGHRRRWSLSEVSSAMRRKDEPRRYGTFLHSHRNSIICVLSWQGEQKSCSVVAVLEIRLRTLRDLKNPPGGPLFVPASSPMKLMFCILQTGEHCSPVGSQL
jgi:hypothetical protein